MNSFPELTLLIERVRQKEPGAATELVALFAKRIIQILNYSHDIDKNDIEDLSQEINMALIQSIEQGTFDSAKGTPLEGYLQGIIKNKVINYLRTPVQRNVFTDLSDAPPAIFQDGGDAIDRAYKAKLLRQAMSKLHDKYKEVLYLRYFEELSVREIAERLDLSPRRVSERIHYGIKLLRKELKKSKKVSIFSLLLLIE